MFENRWVTQALESPHRAPAPFEIAVMRLSFMLVQSGQWLR
jgi:hypothetical protein